MRCRLYLLILTTPTTHSASLSLQARGEKWLEKQLFIDWFHKQVTGRCSNTISTISFIEKG
jgi:hypothetical protein